MNIDDIVLLKKPSFWNSVWKLFTPRTKLLPKPKTNLTPRPKTNLTPMINNGKGVCFSCQLGGGMDFVMPCCQRLAHKSCVLEWMVKHRPENGDLRCPYCNVIDPLKFKDILLNNKYKTSQSNLINAQAAVWSSFAPINTSYKPWISRLTLSEEIQTLLNKEFPDRQPKLDNSLKVVYALLGNASTIPRDELFTAFMNSIVSLHHSFHDFVQNYERAYLLRKGKVPRDYVLTNEHKYNSSLFHSWNSTTIIIGILHRYPPDNALNFLPKNQTIVEKYPRLRRNNRSKDRFGKERIDLRRK